MRSRAVLVALLVCAFAATGTAATSMAGGAVTVDANETVRGDLTATGGVVVIRGTVDGDLSVFAGDVVIDGTVTGSVEAVAGSVRVSGTTGSLAAVAGAITVTEDGVVDGDAELSGGAVHIAGQITGDASVAAQSLTLPVTGHIVGGLAYDTEKAILEGRVDGGTERTAIASTGPAPAPWLDGILVIAWFLARVGIAALLLVMFPAYTERLRDALGDDPARMGAYGLGALLAAPFLLLMLILLIVGIPVAVMAVLLAPPLLWIASLYAAYFAGEIAVDRLDMADDSIWYPLILGMGGWAVVGLIPGVGVIFQLVATLPVVGAALVLLRDRFRGR